jgi:transcriptional regulator with PAS, ATPase and Fis domain
MLKIAPRITLDRLFDNSEPMRKLRELVLNAAPADVPVLITGPSGAGKNLLAKAIHLLSPRQKKPFIEVSCVNIPHELLESELFGYEKGAFTGAYQSKPGRVEFGNGGTLFLDEIGDIPMVIQGKLLRLLQEGIFSRLGGYRDIQADVRIISATNHNLEVMVKEGRFREDLFFRINVIKLEVPSLYEKKEEIPILAKIFQKNYCEDYNRPLKPISKQNMQILQRYHWPGNIRELENTIKRLVLLGEEAATAELKEKMENADLSKLLVDPSSRPSGYDLKKVSKIAAQRAESLIIRDALDKVKWKKKEAAKLLKISYKALLYKMEKYSIRR